MSAFWIVFGSDEISCDYNIKLSEVPYLNARPTKILIADWIPSLNKGELAILIGMLKTFETLGKTKVRVFSFYPHIDKERYPKNVKIIDVVSDLHLLNSVLERPLLIRLSAGIFAMLQHLFFGMLYSTIGDNVTKIMKKRLWREYCECDLIITCHDQVNCIYGPEYLLFFPLYITMLAKALHKPLVFYANGWHGFPKFKTSLAKFFVRLTLKVFAKYIFNNVDLITVRDEESYNYLKGISKNRSPTHLTADPSILLSPVENDRVRSILKETNVNKCDGLLIGMSLTRETLQSAYPEIRNADERYKKAIAEMARLVDRLISKFRCTIVFVPHCVQRSLQKDDRNVAKQIYNLTAKKHNVVVLTEEFSPAELKGLIGVFDVFIGSRVHSVLNALSIGVPSITLSQSSDRRAYGLIGGMFKQEEWIYEIEGLNSDKLLLIITELVRHRHKLRRKLALQTKVAEEKALLNGKLLKALVDSHMKK